MESWKDQVHVRVLPDDYYLYHHRCVDFKSDITVVNNRSHWNTGSLILTGAYTIHNAPGSNMGLWAFDHPLTFTNDVITYLWTEPYPIRNCYAFQIGIKHKSIYHKNKQHMGTDLKEHGYWMWVKRRHQQSEKSIALCNIKI